MVLDKSRVQEVQGVEGGVKSTHHTNHFHENNLEIRQD